MDVFYLNFRTFFHFNNRSLRFLLVLLICVVTVLDVTSQPGKKGILKKAEQDFANKKYNFALQNFLKLYEGDSTNIDYCYAIGVCYLNASAPTDKTKAIKYLIKYPAIRTIYKDAWYYLGAAYHLAHRFDDAQDAYRQYLIGLKNEDIDFVKGYKDLQEVISEVERRMKQCEQGKFLVAYPINAKIINLGQKINGPYGDYVPVVSADESVLIYTSRRKGSVGGRLTDLNEYFEDIYISENKNGEWSSARKLDSLSQEMHAAGIKDPNTGKLPPLINTETHDAAIGLSADGQKLFIYRADEKKWGDIYMCNLDGRQWKKPLKLGESINSRYWEGHAALSADEKVLYFASNRPNGYGGKDIYKSVRMPGREWGPPVNLGPSINTPYDEESPFMHPDGRHLYFSSEGHKSMGGFDIFVSEMDEMGNWKEADNIGYPINTADDDIYFVLVADGKHGYFSSAREGGYGHQDIYLVEMPPDHLKKPVLTLVKGVIMACGKPVRAEIEVINNLTGKTEGRFNSNEATGKYVLALPSRANYNITFWLEGHLLQSRNIHFPQQEEYIELEEDIDMLCGQPGDQICLDNIFFQDTNKVYKKPESQPELKNLFSFLQRNPFMKLVIKAFYNSGNPEIDQIIAQTRAEKVAFYLTDKGISEERIIPKGISIDSTINIQSYTNKLCIKWISGLSGRKNAPPKTINNLLLQKLLVDCPDEKIRRLNYRVQLGAYRDPSLVDYSFLSFQAKDIFKEIFEDGIIRYTVGNYVTVNEADTSCRSVIGQGVWDAWIVPYYKRKRISLIEAREICTGKITIILDGRVLDKMNERPVYFSKVWIVNDSTGGREMYYTPDDGKFQTILETDSRYTIIASKKDHQTDTLHFSTYGMTESEKIDARLYLFKEAGESPQPTPDPPPPPLPIDTPEIIPAVEDPIILIGAIRDQKTGLILDSSSIQLVELSTNDGSFFQVPDGKYQFELQAQKEYLIRGKKDGYLTNTNNFTTLEASSGDTINEDVILTLIVLNKAIRIENIYYDFDRWNIRPDAALELDKLVNILKENPKILVELGSHTDSRGRDEYNLTLSQKRATSAVGYIISQGISSSRITAKGYGEKDLVNECGNGVECSDQQHQENRRTEFKITGFTGIQE